MKTVIAWRLISMDKIIEDSNALAKLLDHVDVERLDEVDSWINSVADMDFNMIAIVRAENRYFLHVDFGLIGAVWNISESGKNQFLQVDSLREKAEWVEQMVNEPIIDRSDKDD